MITRALLFSTLLATATTSCSKSRDHPGHDHGEFYASKIPGEVLLAIDHKEWVGLAGPHGFEGHRNIRYWAALDGDGPIFKNPRFQDSPPDIQCIGTITLDRERKHVTVDMQRIVSKPGEPQRTEPHPANGTYLIEEVHPGTPEG